MQLCLTHSSPPSLLTSPHLSPPSLLTSLPQRVSGSGVMLHPSGSTVTSPTSHLIPHPPFHWTSSWPYDLEVLFFFFFHHQNSLPVENDFHCSLLTPLQTKLQRPTLQVTGLTLLCHSLCTSGPPLWTTRQGHHRWSLSR